MSAQLMFYAQTTLIPVIIIIHISVCISRAMEDTLPQSQPTSINKQGTYHQVI